MGWRLVDMQTGHPYLDRIWSDQKDAEEVRLDLLRYHRKTPWWERLQVVNTDVAIRRGKGRPKKMP